jgi:hypothetical protein
MQPVIKMLIISLFLVACGVERKNEEYFSHRSEELKEQLFVELCGVQTLPDLFVRQDSLTSLFNQLARLAVEAQAYQGLCKKEITISQEAKETSRQLAEQFSRVLRIPGARAFLEKCQGQGLDIIDAAGERPRKITHYSR